METTVSRDPQGHEEEVVTPDSREAFFNRDVRWVLSNRSVGTTIESGVRLVRIALVGGGGWQPEFRIQNAELDYATLGTGFFVVSLAAFDSLFDSLVASAFGAAAVALSLLLSVGFVPSDLA